MKLRNIPGGVPEPEGQAPDAGGYRAIPNPVSKQEYLRGCIHQDQASLPPPQPAVGRAEHYGKGSATEGEAPGAGKPQPGAGEGFTEFHRNAWFNVIFLALSATPGEFPMIERDIEDQLMRMEINHFPDRHYPLEPIPDEHERNLEILAIKEELQEHNWWTLYKVLFLTIDWEETYYNKPLTVEYMRTAHFMWEKNPWELGYSTNNPLHEEPGATFFTPYWIARAFGFIQPAGVRVV